MTPREKRMLVVARVADVYGVTLTEVMGRSRRRPIVSARHAAMRAVSAEFGDSSAEIGRLFNRDHTTVLHALDALNRDIAA